jgi:hypothetical protein
MNLEQQIIDQLKKCIPDAISSELVGYNKPLSKLTSDVIASNQDELFSLINTEFSNLIGGPEFREVLKIELNNKLAKILIQRMGGELEKQVNNLKQNPETRAKITLAISQIIDEI